MGGEMEERKKLVDELGGEESNRKQTEIQNYDFNF